MAKKGPKPKKINFELIDDNSKSEPYQILRRVRKASHEDTADARIALAWRKALKPDVDGHLILGRCMKASDLQRELIDWDFVIFAQPRSLAASRLHDRQKEALVDHELCHAAQALDSDGEPKMDEKNRPVWRVRKHDIEEFKAVVQRHGCYKHDLEAFAAALLRSKQGSLSLSKAS